MSSTALKLLLVYNKAYGSLTAYPWMFAANGCFQIDVLAPRGHVVHRSRWISETFDYEDASKLLETLLPILETGEYAGVHCIDESSRNLILENRSDARLKPYLPFPAESPLNDLCRDKVSFHEWMAENGLPVPQSYAVETLEELSRCAEEMGYPFILKGATGSRGSTVSLVESSEQLSEQVAAFPDMRAWLVQEYLPGPSGTTSILSRNGKLYAECSSYKRVMLDGGFGISAVKEFVHSEELSALARLVAEKTQVSGATGYDWMMNRDGRVLIIDPHFGRGPSSMMVSHLDGVLIDRALLAAYSKGEAVSREPSKIKYVWIFPQCINLLFEGRIAEAWKTANPFRTEVALFWFGRKEWSLFVHQAYAPIVGKLRVLGGRIRAKLCGSQ